LIGNQDFRASVNGTARPLVATTWRMAGCAGVTPNPESMQTIDHACKVYIQPHYGIGKGVRNPPEMLTKKNDGQQIKD
jgi:hypothetical protein